MSFEGPVLDVRGLTVSVSLSGGERATVVDNVSFQIEAGGRFGLVGESGSGKTMTSLAIMGLLPLGAQVEAGEVLLEGEDLLAKSADEMRQVRGRKLAMVLQSPMTALDPSFIVKTQLSYPLRKHRGLHGRALERGLVTSLEQVHLAATPERLNQFPHQLSGGMAQRVTSAIALAGQPRLLIADEPVTALDGDMQLRYLSLLRELQETHKFALLLVEHDLNVVRLACESVGVMYATQVVETGPVSEVFARPRHPYTHALMGAVPDISELVEGKWLEAIEGQAPDIGDATEACRFAPRCKYARDVCRADAPQLEKRRQDSSARCWGTRQDGWIEW